MTFRSPYDSGYPVSSVLSLDNLNTNLCLFPVPTVRSAATTTNLSD